MLRIPWNWNIIQINYAQNIIANIQRGFRLAHYNDSFTPIISCRIRTQTTKAVIMKIKEA